MTSIANGTKEDALGYIVLCWFREEVTIAFLHEWELRNNPNFSEEGYGLFLQEMKKQSFTFSAKKWSDMTGAIGIYSKQGKSGGTYAHREIACAFKAWLCPDFQYALVQSCIAAHDEKW